MLGSKNKDRSTLMILICCLIRYMLAGQVHPGDISSDDSSDEDVGEIQKTPDNDDVKLAAFKKIETRKKRNERTPLLLFTKRMRRAHYFDCTRTNTCLKIETVAEKISTSIEASSAPPTSQVPSIAEAMKMVKNCGVQEKTPLMHTTTFLIIKPEFREIFSMLETNEGRFNLLEREHTKELMRRM
uniref:Uncharacterized protein n=1 Tax=Setaria viridis TaxID=4556 RepID=A0A4U6W504_SETVI|nr:hypothetical protein SEVIR_2G457200v2 [Setaria viridis]TKW36704.1 hypothetical protein SEVIR_2G457200v2 [Setaria viridis]TKW36705.1 hypothetical protein SEVIR_2G457200v2 [Setaria viridis]